MSRRYFEEEMRYLHEAGKAFAQAYPEQARYLNVDSVTDRDPYVERLFEGFAFLTGRIRERLDDELPQYTETLCGLLFPHFLKPIPALAMVEFKPRPGEVQKTTVLPRGTEVRSEPVGEDRTVCRFVTTQDVRLQPVRLVAADLGWRSDGTSTLTLRFQLEGGADFHGLKLSPLRLHFHTEPSTASYLHLYCTRHVRRVLVGSGGFEGGKGAFGIEPVVLPGQDWVQPGGLGEDEGLLPYAPQTFSGFRLLQEYLTFRRKFWCIDLLGLERFAPTVPVSSFDVQLVFDRPFPEERRFRAEDLRLFCSPVVNLFEHDADPIRVDHRVPEYLVPVNQRQRLEVYDVLRGVGIEDETGRRHEYLPFLQFRHTRTNGDKRYFTSTSGFGPTGRYQTTISLDALDHEGRLAPETLSLEVRCTNGAFPREKLQERTITKLAPGVPDIVRPSNLTQPTLILYPPVRQQQDFFWKLLSHWSFNYQTVASREALQGLLELYDWTNADANRRRIGGIRSVTWQPKEILHRGAILRGAEVTIQVQEDHFADEGDVVLFGLVLSRFFSLYATLNSFVHLTLELLLSGKRYQWQPKQGTRPIL